MVYFEFEFITTQGVVKDREFLDFKGLAHYKFEPIDESSSFYLRGYTTELKSMYSEYAGYWRGDPE